MNLSKIKETNTYIIIYAVVMVVIVAFLLAYVALALKPTQDANVLRDTKNQILTSLNITGLKGAAIDQKFQEVVVDTIAVGEKVVYAAVVDGQTKYIFPVKGRGLWGGLWGYISLNEDKQNVYGTYFSHESETAGLGSRIVERVFQESFNGRPVFGDNPSQVALTVTKAGSAKAETEVNGITGATLTSNGVAAMVTDGLQSYIEFISGGATSATCPEGESCKKEACDHKCGDCPEGESCKQGECDHKCGECPEGESCEKDACDKKEGACAQNGNCPKNQQN